MVYFCGKMLVFTFVTIQNIHKNELNGKGVFFLCTQVVAHTLRDFSTLKCKYPSQKILHLQNMHNDYMHRITFVCKSKLFEHVFDIMEYDTERMRKVFIKELDKRYEQAQRYYR
jgi:hypothetical protein